MAAAQPVTQSVSPPGALLDRGPTRRPARSVAVTAVALGGWAALTVSAHLVGDHIASLRQTGIFVPPLVARFDPRVAPAILLPLTVAALAVAFAPLALERLSWRGLLWVAFGGATLWAVSVALADGVRELTRPVLMAGDYRLDVASVVSPASFLSHFVQRIGRYHQHVRAHPPGMVLLLWAMGRAGFGAPGWEAGLEILGGAAMVPAAMVVLKEVAAERWGRSAMPFLTFAPAAVWVATTGDAFFGGVVAWSVALIVLAIHRNGRRADVLAVGGGILFGAALFLTYGVTLLAALPVSVAAARRRGRPLLLAALGVAGVVVAFRIAGFWWVAGLRATIVQYRASVARLRPQSYFWWANLATFAVVLGPTTAVALARLRDRRVWLVVAGALIAMAAADVTGLSRAEVERIWLPFAPWILAAGAVLVARRVAFRAWLALSMAAGLAVQVLLRTAW